MSTQERDVSASDFLTLQECAERAGVSASTIKREVRDGKLRPQLVGGKKMIRLAAWQEYCARIRFEALPHTTKRRIWSTHKWAPNKAHDELLETSVSLNKIPFPYCGPAIYFLYQGDEIVYVGKAVKLLGRLSGHFGNKDFDHVSWLACPVEELDELERRAILKFNPKFNLR